MARERAQSERDTLRAGKMCKERGTGESKSSEGGRACENVREGVLDGALPKDDGVNSLSEGIR